MPNIEALIGLGWDTTFADAFAPHAEERAAARVAAEHRDRYVVTGELGDVAAVLAGRFRHEVRSRLDLPAVGDWVAVSLATTRDDVSTIHAVLPRRTAFVRKVAGDETDAQVVAANVDVALIVTALPDDLNPRRLERYLALAWESGALPAVVLTKTDLADDVAEQVAAARLVAPGVDVVALSSMTGEGVDALDQLLRPGRTAVLLGMSGAGKSTLINRLLGADRLRTGTIRDDGRGRHTTTHRELVQLENGALLIDTPGMRELQLWDADSGIGAAFSDIYELSEECRFRDCRHDSEPGCAVLAAVAEGRLPADRLESWRKLERELAYLERRQIGRGKDRTGQDALAAELYQSRAKSLERLYRQHVRQKYQ